MSDESAMNKGWIAVLAVVVVVAAGYFIYKASQTSGGNVPQIKMSREEVMRNAMVDGPGNVEPANAPKNEPKTATLKKGG